MLNNDEIVDLVLKRAEEKGYEKEQIQFIALTGSVLIKDTEDDLNDIDVLVVMKNMNKKRDMEIEKNESVSYQLFYEDLEEYKERLNFKRDGPRQIYNIYNDFYNVIHGKNDNDFHVFEYKDKMTDIIKEAIYPAGFNRKSTVNEPKWKHFVAPYLFFKVIDNNKYELTDEMIKTARKIYKGEATDVLPYMEEKTGFKLNPRIRRKYKI